MSALLISAVALQAGAAFAAPDGAAIFAQRCVQCHQANAQGADGLAPSLAGPLKAYAATPEGRQYLSQILVSGMAGRIESEGRVLMGIMPRFGDDLTDADIAATLDYVLAHFNGVTTAPITAASVADARARKPSPGDTRKLRAAVVAGIK